MKHTYCPALAAAMVLAGPAASAAQPRAVVTPPPRAVATLPRPALASIDTTAVMSEYRLGPGDKLRIEVYKDNQLSQSVQIRPDGKITLPLIGDLEATDRTPLQLRDEIAGSLKEYITNPVVTVIVVEALASQVYVMGQVAKSGPVQIHGPTTILQALAVAGGLNEFANKKDVRVLRPTSTGVETISFNYQDAVNGEIKPIYLRAGDTVIVR
jgi:polysaccharide export outer membrane protein